MVGRDHAALAVVGKLGAVHIAEDLGPGAEIHDEAGRLAARRLRGSATAPLTIGATSATGGDLGLEGPRLEHDRPPLAQAALGERHHLDHALISLAGAVAEGEDAVLVQDQPLDVGLLLEHFGRGLGEAEARRDIGHDAHAPVIDLARQRLAVGLIDQRQHRGGMGVVDEFVRQEGVEQRLDRGVRRRGVEQVEALHVDHGFVGERLERAQAPQRLELHRGHALRLDVGHVPARALDADDLVLLAEVVGGARLHRGVAAAVKHEQRVAAQEPRGVDPKREILAGALGAIPCHRVTRGAVIPFALHGACNCKFASSPQVKLRDKGSQIASWPRAEGLSKSDCGAPKGCARCASWAATRRPAWRRY